MLILLAAIFAIHIIGIILLLVATIDNGWWLSDNMATDVWVNLMSNQNDATRTCLESNTAYYLQAVQASAVLACIFSILGIFVFVAQLFTLSKGKRFTISGIFQALACLCIMIAASIYTDRFHLDEKNGWYGHCYILAWISFALTFISSITYFVLRKKTG
uniref:Epithelial membrane protein 1 n=1 Tax=Tetraodon nigroviridis TaxID=99883 RepID=H3CZU4_TETNG